MEPTVKRLVLICCSCPLTVVLSLQPTGVCVLGGSFFQRTCFRGSSSAWIGSCQEPGRVRSHPSPRYHPILSPLWPAGGRLNTRHSPHGMMHASGAWLEGASLPSIPPPAAIFFLPARDETSCVRRGFTVELVTVYEYELWICCVNYD